MAKGTKGTGKLKVPKALEPAVNPFGPRSFWINPLDKEDPESPWFLADPDAELEEGCTGALVYNSQSTPLLIGRVAVIRKNGKSKQVTIGKLEIDLQRNPSASIVRIVGRFTPTNWRADTDLI